MKSFPIPSKWPISVVAGILVIIIFWGFAIISMSFFPGVYNPFEYWMSDLGSTVLNPKGAIFFNIGCIITGIFLIPFFLGLYEWYIGGRRNKILTILTQIAGILSAFSMIMLGVFSEDYLEIHIFWALSLFTLTIFTFILPSLALYKYKFTRNIAKFGIVATIINLVMWIFIYPIFEWITILFSFCFIGIIIHSMYKRIERFRFVRKQNIIIPSKRKKKRKK
jgi:cbb3-type cytochrome oxidase subunit 3